MSDCNYEKAVIISEKFASGCSIIGSACLDCILGFNMTSRRPCWCTAKKVFWEFDSMIMQNLSNILPLFCTPTWPSHENQELHVIVVCSCSLTVSNVLFAL